MLTDLAAVERTCAAVEVPVNVLAAGPLAAVSCEQLAQASAARISLGSGLARISHSSLITAARSVLAGDFNSLAQQYL